MTIQRLRTTLRFASATLGLSLLGGMAIDGLTARDALAIGIGERLPAYMLTDLGGRSHDLSAQKGSVLLIHIFGHSAQVCYQSAPRLESNFHQKYSARGLRVYGVESWSGTQSEVEDFRTTTDVTYPLLLGGAAFASECDLSYNSFLLVDASGIVRYVSPGPAESAFDEATLSQRTETYLDQVATADLRTWGAIKTLYNR